MHYKLTNWLKNSIQFQALRSKKLVVVSFSGCFQQRTHINNMELAFL